MDSGPVPYVFLKAYEHGEGAHSEGSHRIAFVFDVVADTRAAEWEHLVSRGELEPFAYDIGADMRIRPVYDQPNPATMTLRRAECLAAVHAMWCLAVSMPQRGAPTVVGIHVMRDASPEQFLRDFGQEVDLAILWARAKEELLKKKYEIRVQCSEVPDFADMMREKADAVFASPRPSGGPVLAARGRTGRGRGGRGRGRK